ncbi:helix-turn-helix domain-containing protein [Arthrobacter sp. G119Y2]|uniref:helix-turn-helix domain-containing protein n=1 Tax=Arthrobacter sp. G119Y2 TaxID=3134965 RepID=UPI00311A71BF
MADISGIQSPAGTRSTAGGQRSGRQHPLKPREPLWREVLGELLRRLRHERGLTLGEIADRAGLSPQYLSEIERGLKEPSSEMIEAVAGALGVTLVDLTLAVAETLILAGGDAPAAPAAAVRAPLARTSGGRAGGRSSFTLAA